MKKLGSKLGLFIFTGIAFVACKNENLELAEKNTENLEKYVDSVSKLSAEQAKENWEKISTDFSAKVASVKLDVANLEEKESETINAKIDAASAKIETKKAEVEKAALEMQASNPKQVIRDRFFGAGKIGDDLSFSWVNKTNILSIYQNFLDVYKANKSSFSREDYDEIKLLYEALDARKNTVEKEGLSDEDNRKIAAIKVEFSTMFKVNRIGAKSRENAEAKE